MKFKNLLKVIGFMSLLFIFNLEITAAPVVYTGVNLAGAEFGENNLPGTYGTHYTYPTHGEVDYFTGKGMNTFRLPFRWERLQQSQNAEFNAAELSRLDDFVNYATGKGAYVLLDPHNYARYNGTIIGQGNVPASAFADFWTRLANRYKANNHVIFGLMNEPHDMATELWRDDANAAISAIRATGAANLILVPGNGYTGAHSWLQNWYGTPNGTVMLSITDPLNNFAFDAHQYLDGNSSGTSENCVSATIGSQRLVDFTNWLRTNNRRGFLGEFGGGRNSTCYAALGNMLDYIDANDDVWLGWTYWAAGPWWGEYIFTLEPTNCPTNCTDRPQMAVLAPHFAQQTSARSRYDFDGDGKSDISVFRESNGAWYINNSQNGFIAVTFGQNGDKITPADFDGDGKTDIAVFRNGFWYYLKSSNNSFVGLQFGQSGDIPIPADFDGDNKADINVFRPSNGAWYRLNSSNNSFNGTIFGQNGDKPLIADFDGDGKSDITVFRPSNGTFYSLNSSNGAFRAVAFGLSTDIPTLGDFDGDGKTDVAVFRPSNGGWYRLNSLNGAFVGILFGQNGDVPTAADYDGDGKTDIAVFRNGNWYYLKSSNGAFVGQTFGFSTDKPIPAAFIQ